MAKDDEKTTVQPAETPAKAPAKSNKKLFLFAGIGLGVIVIGVAVALFVLRPMMSSGGGEATASEGKETTEAKKEEGKKPEAEKKKPERKSKEGGEGGASDVYSVEDIVVNPAGTGGSRFLSVSFGFAVDSPELAKQMEEHDAQVRDVLITILSSKTVADLTNPKQKEVMRLQIKKRLSQVLDTDELAGVYYTDFVLQ